MSLAPARSFAVAALVAVLTACTCIVLTAASGITAHTEVSHRALSSWYHRPAYRQILLDNQNDLQAGAPFPDTFYNDLCFKGAFDDVSDHTHHTSWMRVAIEYLREKYPPPLSSDSDGARLFAFLMGVASHSIADAVWHGSLTQVPGGFLDASAWTDFLNDRGLAHTSGDIGGDVVVNYELHTPYMNSASLPPSKDVERIMRQFAVQERSVVELQVTKQVIDICSAMIWVGRVVDHEVLGLTLYPTVSANQSFLVESFYDYYLGGLDNMAAQTVKYWDVLVEQYERGTGICDSNSNPVLQKCEPFQLQPLRQSSLFQVDDDAEFLTEVTAEVTTMITETSAASSASAVAASPVQLVLSSRPYAWVGHSVLTADFNGDGVEDLVIAAPNYYSVACPQAGRVFVIYGDEGAPLIPTEISAIEQIAHAILTVPEEVCDGDRFGFALAAVNLNKDGFIDLAVGAPSRGFGNNAFTGAVYVFAGSASGLRNTPYLTIRGDPQFQHVTAGHALQGGDLDDDGFADLVVASPNFQLTNSAPQQGAVWLFLSTAYSGQSTLYTTNGTTIFGEAPRGRFGHTVAVVSCIVSGYPAPLLLVGAPNVVAPGAPAGLQGVGKIYGYWVRGPQVSAAFQVIGSLDRDHLGHSFAVGRPWRTLTSSGPLVLAASTPARSVDAQAKFVGAIHLLNLDVLASQVTNVSVSDSSIRISTVFGDSKSQRFGWTLLFAPTGALVVTGPFGNNGLVTLGKAYLLDGSQLPHNGEVVTVADLSPLSVPGQANADRFGSSSYLSTSGILFIYAANSNAGPARYPGALYVFNLGAL